MAGGANPSKIQYKYRFGRLDSICGIFFRYLTEPLVQFYNLDCRTLRGFEKTGVGELVLMGSRALRPLHCSLTLPHTPACAPPNRRHLSQSIPLLAEGITNKADSKAFSNTLLLPKTSFPLRSDPSKAEFRKKTCEDLYRWQVCRLYHLPRRSANPQFFYLLEVVGQC